MQTAQILQTTAPHAAALSAGLLIARLVFGLAMSAHGAQKLFGWFGGYGLNKTGEFFVQLGFRPGRMLAAFASATEITGGLLLATGFLGPVGPALIVSVMIVAVVTVHWSNGFFAATNGIEVPLLFGAVAVVLAFTGPGSYSLDALLGLQALWSPAFAATALGVGILGAIANLTLRRRALSASSARMRTT
jgi:putative oxidoreductase